MNKTEHLDAFLDALHRRDIASVASCLADDVVIRSPIVDEPFEGKQRVEAVLARVLDAIDVVEVKHVLRDDAHFAILLAMESGETKIDGVDYLHLNKVGLIDNMMIMWRPLSALIQVQNRLAPAIGMPVLKLVSAEPAV